MAELKIKPKGLRGGKDPSMWGPTRTGYITRWHQSLVMQNESGIPRGRNRMNTAPEHRGRRATVVLTGNPGSPGMPSGPCDIRKTKWMGEE